MPTSSKILQAPSKSLDIIFEDASGSIYTTFWSRAFVAEGYWMDYNWTWWGRWTFWIQYRGQGTQQWRFLDDPYGWLYQKPYKSRKLTLNQISHLMGFWISFLFNADEESSSLIFAFAPWGGLEAVVEITLCCTALFSLICCLDAFVIPFLFVCLECYMCMSVSALTSVLSSPFLTDGARRCRVRSSNLSSRSRFDSDSALVSHCDFL
jgi:hypothetical protein